MAKHKKPPATLSDQLRERIGDARVSVYDLAAAAAVDRSILSRFLRGERTITLETADRLARVLKLRLVEGR
jgi:plasmid maintenance system antidote protein VapI